MSNPVQEVRHFACTIPAGTSVASPVTVQLQFPVRVVEWIDLEVATGPNGNVGFYIASSRVQQLPFVAGTYMITTGTYRRWDLQDQPDSGDWQLIGYNLGTYPHTIYVSFGLNLVSLATPSITVISADALSSS